LIADSKLVYSPARGLLSLETGVLALLGQGLMDAAFCLSDCLELLCPDSEAAVASEPWFGGDSRLPLVAREQDVAAAACRFRETCARRRLVWGRVHSVIVCPPAFNALVDRWGSKGAVLGHGLALLVQRLRDSIPGDEALVFHIDKHGGRNHYAATLQNAVPEAMIVASEESAGRSTYTALGLEQAARFTFQPRADAEHFCVAAASMVSKYLRELLMHEFNRFWRTHVPDLKPTAGYPGDAARFLAAVRPAVQRLGLDETALWRRK
jgi:hypothetical protein